MKISRIGTAVLALAGTIALGSAGAARADVPYQDYSKYVTITGPTGLEVGGDWGVWTLQAKNPNAAVDTTDHLVFNAFGTSDIGQLQFQYRVGTSGAWTAAPIAWNQMSSDPKRNPYYMASMDFTGHALTIAPHSAQTYQLRARRVATKSPTAPFPTEFSAYLTPKQSDNGQGGDFTARADTGVAPLGLTTKIVGLPTAIPADGRSRQFQIRITAANHADWRLPSASFFIWQGQKYGQMSGPKACDAEMDVLDPATKKWHRVGLGAAGVLDETVDLKWATGPAYDRTLTARITLGAGFNASGPDAAVGFGYFPGSGDPDYFWVKQHLSSSHTKGAPACAKPTTALPPVTTAPKPTTPPTKSAAPTHAATSTGGALATTGASSNTGLLAGAGAALLAAGTAAVAITRRKGRRA
jgi:hypothetical protein